MKNFLWNVYMYRLNLRNFSNLKGSKKEDMVCSYCLSKDHTLKTCHVDNELGKLLLSEQEPDFNSMSINILRKIGFVGGLKLCGGKLQLVLQLKKAWLNNKKIKKTKTHCSDDGGECPICYEDIKSSNFVITKCCHKFCTPCFTKTIMKKNSCPLCREMMIDDKDYIGVKGGSRVSSDEDYMSFTEGDGPFMNYIEYIRSNENMDGLVGETVINTGTREVLLSEESMDLWDVFNDSIVNSSLNSSVNIS